MLNSAKLLILDDLGTERNTDFALEKVYNVIDSRVRASMPDDIDDQSGAQRHDGQ